MSTRSHKMQTRSMQKTATDTTVATIPSLPDGVLRIIREKVVNLSRAKLLEECRPHLGHPVHRRRVSFLDSDTESETDEFTGEVNFFQFVDEELDPSDIDWVILHAPVLASRSFVNHYFDDERLFIYAINQKSPILDHVTFLALPTLVFADSDIYPKDCTRYHNMPYLNLGKSHSLDELRTFIIKCGRALQRCGKFY